VLAHAHKTSRESMKNAKIPYWLVLKYYGPRLLVVSLIWFIYDVSLIRSGNTAIQLTFHQFSTYSFGIFSSTILSNILPKDASLARSFGWNTVINLFYIPGAILGSFFSDMVGPRYALVIGVTLQGLVGFLMAGLYPTLAKPGNVGGFAVVYGIFLSLGELGPGDNIGLLASKTCATGVRGQYYAIAAAVGKIGAFVGTYIFPYIEKAGGSDTNASAQYPFYVSSALCLFSAIIAFAFIPQIGQDTITMEDIRFREYLERHGWDTRQLGLGKEGMEVESTGALATGRDWIVQKE
jgi:MFS family permease